MEKGNSVVKEAVLPSLWTAFRTSGGLSMDKKVKKRVNCPFLTGNYLLTCKANNVYVPSQFEFEEYCKSKRHTLCPFFRLKEYKIVVSYQ